MEEAPESSNPQIDCLEELMATLTAMLAASQRTNTPPPPPGGQSNTTQNPGTQPPPISENSRENTSSENPDDKGEKPKAEVENKKVATKLESLEEKIRGLQGIDAYGNVDFSSLCFFPDMKPLPKYKTPEFSKYNGTGCPLTHLRVYCGEMCQYGDDERFLIQQFQKSLTGPALSWFVQLDPHKIHTWSDLANAFLAQYRFNTEIAPDRFELQRPQK